MDLEMMKDKEPAAPMVEDTTENRPGPPGMASLARGPRQRGVKLHWPSAGNRRRSLVGKSAESQTPPTVQVDAARMIHVSHQDVELYFQDARPGRKDSPAQQVFLQVPQPFDPTVFHAERHDLFQYFERVAYKSLAVFGHAPDTLRDALIRIALVPNTTSATALVQAILAVSALHREKVHSQAVELKISALRALGAASGNIGILEAVQHVATVMLLLSFEIQYASCTSGDWSWYLHGVKTVIEAAGLDKLSEHQEMSILLDWVHYHDVTARFSLRHWKRESLGVPSTSLCITSLSTTVCVSPIHSKVPRRPHAGSVLVELLAEVGEAMSTPLPPSANASEVQDHRNFLDILDWRIRNASPVPWPGSDDDTPLMLELYQLSLLLYLHCASGDRFLNQPSKMQEYTNRAWGLMQQLQYCDRQLPVFIMGCEARSDEHRGIVLDLMARSESRPSSRSFNYVRLMLEGLWARDDLADGDLDYMDRVTTIISRCKVVPSFVYEVQV